MVGQASLIRRHAVMIFSSLTIGLSVAATLLPIAGEAVMLVMATIPAVVALALTAATEGRSGVRLLLGGDRWRIRPVWIVVAAVMGLGLRLGVSGAAVVLGWSGPLLPRAWSPAQFGLFAALLLVAAAPEELGWRGYVLPTLLGRRSPLLAGLIVGVAWACAHLPLGLPGMPYAGRPLVPLGLGVVGLSLIATWLFVAGGGNLLATTVFHAAQSLFVVLNDDIAPVQQLWLMAAVYVAVALLVALVWRPFVRQPGSATSTRRDADASVPTPFLPGIDD